MAISELESALGRPVILMFDGLEKLSVDAALRLFGAAGELLGRWPVRCLFVVPVLMLYRPEWLEAEHYAQATEFLPAVPVYLEADKGIEASIHLFAEMAYKKTWGTRRHSEADLDKVIFYGGGLPRQFLQLLREVYIKMSLNGLLTPDEKSVTIAMQRIANGLRRKLRPEQQQRLLTLHELRPNQISGDDFALIGINCLIQYEFEGQVWHDMNPILALPQAWGTETQTE